MQLSFVRLSKFIILYKVNRYKVHIYNSITVYQVLLKLSKVQAYFDSQVYFVLTFCKIGNLIVKNAVSVSLGYCFKYHYFARKVNSTIWYKNKKITNTHIQVIGMQKSMLVMLYRLRNILGKNECIKRYKCKEIKIFYEDRI